MRWTARLVLAAALLAASADAPAKDAAAPHVVAFLAPGPEAGPEAVTAEEVRLGVETAFGTLGVYLGAVVGVIVATQQRRSGRPWLIRRPSRAAFSWRRGPSR